MEREEIHFKNHVFIPSITKVQIAERVTELGLELHEEYKDRNPIFIGVLNGCFIFMSDIIRASGVECETEFVKIKSYHGTKSGEVEEIMALKVDITDRHIIIVEDIVDSGKTLHFFKEKLNTLAPKSVKVVSLLYKPEAMEIGEAPDYIGFSIPKDFVIGYGLDFDGKFRELSSIYKLDYIKEK